VQRSQGCFLTHPTPWLSNMDRARGYSWGPGLKGAIHLPLATIQELTQLSCKKSQKLVCLDCWTEAMTWWIHSTYLSHVSLLVSQNPWKVQKLEEQHFRSPGWKVGLKMREYARSHISWALCSWALALPLS
jgi:hypothetical protein